MIKKIDVNKARGSDCVYSEHIKYASNILVPLLSMCFTSCIAHGFLPDSMLSVVLVPVINDKAGKISSKDNYRPIALASVFSKLIEIIILDRIEMYMDTNPNQFGFKKKHGTNQCIYVLKEVIDLYRSLIGSVFVCFLDASEAFDRVNHRTPFKKQGGILSPYLFDVYVDELSEQLKLCNVACNVNGHLINHIMYADDLILILPSSAGLCQLLYDYEKFGISHDVKYNEKKSAIMIFRSKLCRCRYQQTMQSLFVQGNIILCKFYMCSIDVKLTLFHTYCSPMYSVQ